MNYQTFRRVDHLVIDEYGIDPLASPVFDLISNVEAYTLHELTPEQVGNAPLLAYQVYGSEDLWWIILAYNAILDPEQELIPGKILRIPDFASINSSLSKLRTATRTLVTI
jgi:hypothetical protein